MMPEENATNTEPSLVADSTVQENMVVDQPPPPRMIETAGEGLHNEPAVVDHTVPVTTPDPTPTVTTPAVDYAPLRQQLLAVIIDERPPNSPQAKEAFASYHDAVLQSLTDPQSEWQTLREQWLALVEPRMAESQTVFQQFVDTWYSAHRHYQTLFDTIKPFEERVIQELIPLNDQDSSFLEAPDELRDRLLNYRKGLEIIQRMIKRLHEKRKTFEPLVPTVNQPPLWPEDVPALENWQAAYDSFNEAYRGWCNRQHQLTRDLQRRIDQIQQESVQWLKQLIGAFDGLEAGDRGELEMRTTLESQWPDRLALSQSWLGVYTRLEQALHQVFATMDIQISQPEIGTMFVPDLMEPIATVSDPQRQNEEVASVLRRGYLFAGRMVRPSMVEVVMNSTAQLPE